MTVFFMFKMVPLVSFLAALRILTEAQICNNGEGKIAYEKTISSLNNRFKRLDEVIDNRTTELGYEILQKSELPLKVLEGCFQRCQDDKLSKLSSCVKFDFLPGKRINSNDSDNANTLPIYEPSKCVFYNATNSNIAMTTEFKDLPKDSAILEFNEVCLSAQKIQKICPNRAYIFESIPGYRLADQNSKAYPVSDRIECQNRCLNEQQFTCRSAQYEPLSKKCFLSPTNRHSLPDKFKPEGHFEYMENLCLKHNEMCKWNVFIIEKEKQMNAELEKLVMKANNVANCSNQCLESIDKYGFICRAFMFDESSQTCALYEEDPLDEMKTEDENNAKLQPGKGNLYRVLCSTDDKDKELDNKTLECHRHKRLRGRHHVEIRAGNFYECLTGCMRQFNRDCSTIEYSALQQTCRFSGRDLGGWTDSYNDTLMDDNVFDFYQFKWNQDEPEKDSLKTEKLGERQDPIEASNSQPGANYNNFVLPITPIEQVRDTNNIDDNIRPPIPDSRPRRPENIPSRNDIDRNDRLRAGESRSEIEQFRISSTPYQIQQIREPPQYPTKGTSPIVPMSSQRKPQIIYPDPYYRTEQRRITPPIPNSIPMTPATPMTPSPIGRQTHISTYPERRFPEQKRDDFPVTPATPMTPSPIGRQTHISTYPERRFPEQKRDDSKGGSRSQASWNGSFRYTTMSPRSGFHGGQSRIMHGPEYRPEHSPASGPPYSMYQKHMMANLPPSPANKLLSPYGGGGPYSGHLMSSSSSINSASTISSIQSASSSIAISYDRYGNKNSNCRSAYGESEVEILKPKFKRVGFSTRLKSKHIYKVVRADKLEDCEQFCLETKDFECKSFNYRAFFPDNCELSSVDSAQYNPESADDYETNSQFDFYEKYLPPPTAGSLMAPGAGECIEVLQNCSPEGMEFKLRTPEGFYGRIYSYGFYDSCFFDGNGASESVLKISTPNSFPRCGTQQIGDAMSAIVVVQFNDYVQTSRDKMYNLTCYISGPGEAVVTSSYLDTKMEGYAMKDGRHPMQIEHLPAQNVLSNNVQLRINYRGNPTSTIVVGEMLTFRLESKNKYNYNGYFNDIFATNVIAKDPYTGRQVLLIDSRGCPVDLYVFPELQKTADGGLEAEFYAFKIPDSNFLVFQATVRTCKGPCEPVICSDRSRTPNTFPSYGRRRRSTDIPRRFRSNRTLDEEEVHEMFTVYLSEEDIPQAKRLERPSADSSSIIVDGNNNKVCLNIFAYYTLIGCSLLATTVIFIVVPYWAFTSLIKQRLNQKSPEFGYWPTSIFNSFRARRHHETTAKASSMPSTMMFTPSFAGQGSFGGVADAGQRL